MDDWDNIDWDEKVEDIIKSQQKTMKISEQSEDSGSSAVASQFKFRDDDENYFEKNQEKKRLESDRSNTAASSKCNKVRKDNYIQPYSTKELVRIRDYTENIGSFHNLIYETYGEFERFLLTHQLENLAHENIVMLMKIDVCLLEVPFHEHNQLLLDAISTLDSFWSHLVEFLKEFFKTKHKDVKFLLRVDMNGFFDNIELMMHNLLVNNHFNAAIESVFTEIVTVMESNVENKWSQPEKLQRLQEEYRKSQDVYRMYDIYPTIDDLKASPEKQVLSVNIVKGFYNSVSHYLQVQIPLLKEDFVNKLRDGIQHLKSIETFQRFTKTPNVWIYPNVEIKAVTRKIWNMNCRSLVVKQRYKHKSSIGWIRRFFNGQMLCFSSTNTFNDLVIAIVMNRDPTDQQSEEITIEVIRTENISEIFNRDLIMIEPAAFFEPYHRVFNVMKNLNELNFPFKNQIVKLREDIKFLKHLNEFTYKNFTFKVGSFLEWPSEKELCLETMQLKAIQKALTSELTLIQGPPGCGKTFVGLEILRILLENTNETILVLTQTNNALDKFLVGASEFTSSIVRMGGQSKSDELELFTVKATTPLESKKYMKKLQAQHQDAVAKLSSSDENQDEVHRSISTHHRLVEEVHQLSSFYSVYQKRIIGMTTTFAARNSAINKMLKPSIVMIEEASEVLESHVLVSLTKYTKQLIMIGDHQQLKPLTNSFDLAKNFNFNVSLFERLIRNNFSFVTLDVQMRMKPEICDLVRRTIYEGLKDGAVVETYPTVKGMSRSFFCLNHSQPESVSDGETSKKNLFEAEYVVQLCDHMISKGNEPRQITILTAYAAQAQRIKRRLTDSLSSEVKVAVLDAYQGEESDIIVLSLVRSNIRREIGFLANDNRIAVVLSRAKFGFFIIANMECLAGASKIWKKVQSILIEKQAIGDKIPGVDIIVK